MAGYIGYLLEVAEGRGSRNLLENNGEGLNLGKETL